MSNTSRHIHALISDTETPQAVVMKLLPARLQVIYKPLPLISHETLVSVRAHGQVGGFFREQFSRKATGFPTPTVCKHKPRLQDVRALIVRVENSSTRSCGESVQRIKTQIKMGGYATVFSDCAFCEFTWWHSCEEPDKATWT